jgi:hypothetical protein
MCPPRHDGRYYDGHHHNPKASLPWKKRYKRKKEVETPLVDQSPGHACEMLPNVYAIEWRDRQSAKCEILCAFAEQGRQWLADDKAGCYQANKRRYKHEKTIHRRYPEKTAGQKRCEIGHALSAECFFPEEVGGDDEEKSDTGSAELIEDGGRWRSPSSAQQIMIVDYSVMCGDAERKKSSQCVKCFDSMRYVRE